MRGLAGPQNANQPSLFACCSASGGSNRDRFGKENGVPVTNIPCNLPLVQVTWGAISGHNWGT
jgi:hypothetical protein